MVIGIGLIHLVQSSWVFYQILNLSILRNTQLSLSKLSISWNTQLENTQVEYLVKYLTWVDQVDKSIGQCSHIVGSEKNMLISSSPILLNLTRKYILFGFMTLFALCLLENTFCLDLWHYLHCAYLVDNWTT